MSDGPAEESRNCSSEQSSHSVKKKARKSEATAALRVSEPDLRFSDLMQRLEEMERQNAAELAREVRYTAAVLLFPCVGQNVFLILVRVYLSCQTLCRSVGGKQCHCSEHLRLICRTQNGRRTWKGKRHNGGRKCNCRRITISE